MSFIRLLLPTNNKMLRNIDQNNTAATFLPAEMIYLIMRCNIHTMSVFNQLDKQWNEETKPLMRGIFYQYCILYSK